MTVPIKFASVTQAPGTSYRLCNLAGLAGYTGNSGARLDSAFARNVFFQVAVKAHDYGDWHPVGGGGLQVDCLLDGAGS